MNELAMKIKHPKLRGEWAELRFMAAAAEHGLHVTKPWGETLEYDFIVEREAKFVRVQVKSTGFKDRGGYSCSVRRCRGAYEGNPFDYLAVYLVPEDLWYIIPEESGAREEESRDLSATEEVKVRGLPRGMGDPGVIALLYSYLRILTVCGGMVTTT